MGLKFALESAKASLLLPAVTSSPLQLDQVGAGLSAVTSLVAVTSLAAEHSLEG